MRIHSSAPVALARASHIGPCSAVTVVVGLLAVAEGLDVATTSVLTAAVLAGQLTIGWGNDLLDAERDRRTGRTDKPLAAGQLAPATVTGALAAAAVGCVVLSLLLGWRAGLVHLVLGVASGHAYNAFLKATAWSWLPYAVAFGSLPAAVTLSGERPTWPPWWVVGAAVALGVAAHFLNALPDLEDDEATGVRGLPHRLGRAPSRLAATALLVIGSAVAVLGPGGQPPGWAWAVLGVALGLGAVALRGSGRAPFYAAIVIALLDAALLVAMT